MGCCISHLALMAIANHILQVLVMESEKVIAVGIFNCCRCLTDLLLVLD